MKSLVTPALAVVCAVLQAQAPAKPISTAWERYRLDLVKVSLELPGTLTIRDSKFVATEGDWVRSAKDWEYRDDDVFVSATVFVGMDDTTADEGLIRSVLEDIVQGMSSLEEPAVVVTPDAKPFPEVASLSRHVRVGNEKSPMWIRLTAVGEGNRIVLVAIVSVDDANEVAKRISGSIRPDG